MICISFSRIFEMAEQIPAAITAAGLNYQNADIKRQLREFLARLNTCDGTNRDNLRQWLDQVDSALQWVAGSGPYIPQVAVSRMTGSLARYINAWANPLQLAQKPPDWATMKAEIKATFLENDEEEYLRDAVELVIQRPGEEVRNYALRFKTAVDRAYTATELGQELVLKDLIKVFARGLNNPKVRKEVHYVRPQTLEKAVTTANDAERAESLTDRQTRERNGGRFEEPMEIGALGDSAEIGAFGNSTTGTVLSKLVNSVNDLAETVKCLKEGTQAKGNSGSSGRGNGENQRKKNNDRKCYRCGQPGHIRANCPELEKLKSLEAQVAAFSLGQPPKN